MGTLDLCRDVVFYSLGVVGILCWCVRFIDILMVTKVLCLGSRHFSSAGLAALVDHDDAILDSSPC